MTIIIVSDQINYQVFRTVCAIVVNVAIDVKIAVDDDCGVLLLGDDVCVCCVVEDGPLCSKLVT